MIEPSPPIVISSPQEFQNAIAEATKPLVVDFHADWCQPCKQLAPILAQAVAKTMGKVVLATVDVDKNPEIAQGLQIQSLPSVMAIWQGKPVDGFKGAQPKETVEAFVAKIAKLGGEQPQTQELIEEAFEDIEANDTVAAAEKFGSILAEDDKNNDALAGLALCNLLNGNHQEAKAILQNSTEQNNANIQRANAFLELLEDSNPLLKDFSTSNRSELIQKLLEQIQKNNKGKNKDTKNRELLIKVFTALGNKNPLVVEARRKLSAILFS